MNIRGHMRLVYVAKNVYSFQTRSCAKNITFFLFCFISPFHFPDLFLFFDLQFNYVLAVINLLFNEVEVCVVYRKTHDKPTWFTA